MKTDNGVEYVELVTTLHKRNYRVVKKPDGMSDKDVAESIDSLASLFGFTWNGDILSVYTD